jgi:hypothetical protein
LSADAIEQGSGFRLGSPDLYVFRAFQQSGVKDAASVG